ncbi:cyclopropane-fatty-acyl-phospholipid synthase [Rhodovulum sp. ES.010]|uniref:SAM-dependent methyltransferase n=1 Tax=Rhodovulum sp. ES.010 TaxID=1882821 RepID=UPI000928DE47|nr:cyclopropane-fatty-acyl-phospholipid synthase family protein [Rhodovulum sp. ES.010]SIO55695.1 cyclopropane-fatty-acyl-phospholipid synthase [Rhodovulum sp. ES.010]
MWQKLIDGMLSRFVREGELGIDYPDGTHRRYGPGDGLAARVAIADEATLKAICLDPEMGLGEGYMDGRITVEGDRLHEFMTLLLRNRRRDGLPRWARAADGARFALRDWIQRNTPNKARANVAHHYDISNDFYRLFLDSDMQYSCAYFAREGMTLEEAQAAKKAHIAAKLLIEPDMHVLDIGCGWGGMAITMARDWGARVTGVTLSQNQLELGRARVAAAGLSDRIDLRLQDYRTLDGPFDRIVSVGMFEHVGVPQYDAYFGQVERLLTPEGVALIHTIGRVDGPINPSGWLGKYIFPGGYVPSVSEVAAPIEKTGMWLTDLEIWRHHYARTLEEWRMRFEDRLDAVRAMYDDRFIRMWRYYLVACQATFEVTRQGVLQMQFARDAQTVPLTRDYIAPAEERALIAAQ